MGDPDYTFVERVDDTYVKVVDKNGKQWRYAHPDPAPRYLMLNVKDEHGWQGIRYLRIAKAEATEDQQKFMNFLTSFFTEDLLNGKRKTTKPTMVDRRLVEIPANDVIYDLGVAFCIALVLLFSFVLGKMYKYSSCKKYHRNKIVVTAPRVSSRFVLIDVETMN